MPKTRKRPRAHPRRALPFPPGPALIDLNFDRKKIQKAILNSRRLLGRFVSDALGNDASLHINVGSERDIGHDFEKSEGAIRAIPIVSVAV
jgi:hypothetical protein